MDHVYVRRVGSFGSTRNQQPTEDDYEIMDTCISAGEALAIKASMDMEDYADILDLYEHYERTAEPKFNEKFFRPAY